MPGEGFAAEVVEGCLFVQAQTSEPSGLLFDEDEDDVGIVVQGGVLTFFQGGADNLFFGRRPTLFRGALPAL